MIIVPLAITAWMTATFLTKPEPMDRLKDFYARVQPGGWWDPVASGFNHTLQPVSHGFLIQWIAGILMIYGFTFGIGNLIFNNFSDAVLLLGCAGIGTYLVWNRSLSKLT